jgi:hypothetical protein
MAMEDMRNAYEILVGNPKGRHHLEHLCVVGKIIFNLLLRKQYVRLGLDLSGSREGLVVCYCEYGN